MVDVAVYAAIGAKRKQMQGLVVCLCTMHRVQKRGIFKEVAILDGFGDAGQLLIHHAACADVQMPYLGIAHLPFR